MDIYYFETEAMTDEQVKKWMMEEEDAIVYPCGKEKINDFEKNDIWNRDNIFDALMGIYGKRNTEDGKTVFLVFARLPYTFKQVTFKQVRYRNSNEMIFHYKIAVWGERTSEILLYYYEKNFGNPVTFERAFRKYATMLNEHGGYVHHDSVIYRKEQKTTLSFAPIMETNDDVACRIARRMDDALEHSLFCEVVEMML